MASVPILNAPANISMLDFWAASDDFGGLVRSCRFGVAIRPQGVLLRGMIPFARDLMYLTEAAEMPGRGFNSMPVRYYGPAFDLPQQVEYDDVNLTFICRAASLERQILDDWQSLINPPQTYDFNYRDEYIAEIDVFQFDEAGEAQYCVTMLDAWPKMVHPQPMNWGDDMMQRLVVTFSFHKWVRKGLDVGPRTGFYDFKLVADQGRDVDR